MVEQFGIYLHDLSVVGYTMQLQHLNSYWYTTAELPQLCNIPWISLNHISPHVKFSTNYLEVYLINYGKNIVHMNYFIFLPTCNA